MIARKLAGERHDQETNKSVNCVLPAAYVTSFVCGIFNCFCGIWRAASKNSVECEWSCWANKFHYELYKINDYGVYLVSQNTVWLFRIKYENRLPSVFMWVICFQIVVVFVRSLVDEYLLDLKYEVQCVNLNLTVAEKLALIISECLVANVEFG